MNNTEEQLRTIEDLSNELFYEIFEYLDGCEMYEAFSNLNLRFQHLLIYSSQPLKINLCKKSESMLENYCKQIIIPNKNRIISLRLSSLSTMNKFLKLTPIDTSFSRLESIVLDDIRLDGLHSFFNGLISLTHLFSLTLKADCYFLSFGELYELVFNLPVLKYCKISTKSSMKSWFSRNGINNKSVSSIEHLVMDHDCTINQLFLILSHTPQLCHLTCKYIESSSPNEKNISINLSNLRYISLNNHDEHFNRYETFFKVIHSPIEILHFKTSESIDYVDANRWERLILQHMPHLRMFYFQCSVTFNEKYRLGGEHEKCNGFISSFWTEKQWIFQLKVNVNKNCPREMVYLIHPYRKRWYEQCEYADNEDYSTRFTNQNSRQLIPISKKPRFDNSLMRLPQTVELILTCACSPEEYQLFISTSSYLFRNIHITRLNIDNYEPSIELLIQILYILPNIDALRISSFPIVSSKSIDFKEIKNFVFVSNTSNITTVCLGQMNELNISHFIFMNFWRRVEYLQMTCINKINIEIIIRIILKKYTIYIPHLRFLCFCMEYVNDKMVKQLQTIIDHHKLLDNYTIKQRNNKLYIQWQ